MLNLFEKEILSPNQTSSCSLERGLYIGCQFKEGNMQDFFLIQISQMATIIGWSQMLVPGTSEAFSHYITCVFFSTEQYNKDGCSLGCLILNSLTTPTQENHEQEEGIINILYPINWKSFLQVDDKKIVIETNGTKVGILREIRCIDIERFWWPCSVLFWCR